MAKKGEIQYLQTLGSEGVNHALNKPWSDSSCDHYLIDIGMIMSLLPQPPAKLLDLGCGSGWTSVFFAKRGYEVVGQDICNDMIDLAEHNKAFSQVSSVHFIISDYESLTYKDEFDCAVFYDSLHHAEDEYLALSKVFDALKPGGILITVEPGQGHSKSKASILAMQKYGVTEKDMPPSHIIKLAKSIGYQKFKLYQRVFEPKLIFDDAQALKPFIIRVVKKIKSIIKASIFFPNHDLYASNIVVLTK